ncbi:MAG TPA: hypothetical protein VHA33_24305 [Candidatus Angelobacter sp.]|nr:hypothetical protein [Candidatus Angelobacter sp.]
MNSHFVQINAPTFRCAPGVAWSAESDGIRLVAPDRSFTVRLAYPEAALWDFMARGVSETRATVMMKHIAGFPDDVAASRFIAECLQGWHKQGLITPG